MVFNRYGLFYKFPIYSYFMKLKQVPEDFIVEELYDLDKYKLKEDESSSFKYFKLWKRDYTVNRAIEQICRTFKVSMRDVHFAGTKDRVAVTTQLISMRRLRKNWQEDLNYFNNKNPDIKLEYLGDFPARLNLGDNLGNKFIIVVRDLTEAEIEVMKHNFNKIKNEGVLNLFDSQRFGFSNTNQIVGKYFLRGNFEKALFTILTAIPEENQKEVHLKFIAYLAENWKEILEKNDWVQTMKICPEWLRTEKEMMEWLSKYRNDFLGAMNILPKKIRTLYVGSYQSYLFNETIKYLDSIGKLEQYPELPLVAAETALKDDWGEFVCDLLSRDGLNLDYFEMKSSPTIKPREVMRKTKIHIENLEILEEGIDELNSEKKKIILSFCLGPGSYATNVVKELFGN